MKITLPKKYLINELGLPSEAIVDEITEVSRWSIHHSIVFPYEGKFYRTYYSVGATESQDESPWKYEDEVECFEVELKKVEIMKWVEKKDQN